MVRVPLEHGLRLCSDTLLPWLVSQRTTLIESHCSFSDRSLITSPSSQRRISHGLRPGCFLILSLVLFVSFSSPRVPAGFPLPLNFAGRLWAGKKRWGDKIKSPYLKFFQTNFRFRKKATNKRAIYPVCCTRNREKPPLLS